MTAASRIGGSHGSNGARSRAFQEIAPDCAARVTRKGHNTGGAAFLNCFNRMRVGYTAANWGTMQRRLSEDQLAEKRDRGWVGCRLVCAVPPSHCRDGTEWLTVEHATGKEAGYFLLCRRRRDAPPDAESWHATLEAAMREAHAKWGVQRGCWTVE
jgi:hypothetical protein